MNSKGDAIKTRIYFLLKSGLTDKQEIYTIVAKDLKLPRPSVRRVCIAMRKDFTDYLKVLNDTSKKYRPYKKQKQYE